MGELHSRVLAALDEVTNKNQSQQSPEDNEGFFAVFMRALKSDMSHGGEFDRNAEEGTLVSYLKKSCEFISKIIRVSIHLTLRLSLLWVNVYGATTRTGALGRRLSNHNGFRKQKILKFFVNSFFVARSLWPSFFTSIFVLAIVDFSTIRSLLEAFLVFFSLFSPRTIFNLHPTIWTPRSTIWTLGTGYDINRSLNSTNAHCAEAMKITPIIRHFHIAHHTPFLDQFRFVGKFPPTPPLTQR